MSTNKTLGGTQIRKEQGNNDGRKQKQIKDKHIKDEALYQLCKTYGEYARIWKQKFLGLLPEVQERRLYEKKGFKSIYHFAYVLGGVTREQVERAISVDRKFEKTPLLRSSLRNGEVSVHKLARVAPIANEANEEELLNKSKLLSKSALDTFVKDIKQESAPTQQVHQVVPGHNLLAGEELQLEPEVRKRLLELQQKGVNINDLLTQLLDEREEEIQNKKQELSKQAKQTTSHYVPKAVKDILTEEHGTKCSKRSCDKPAEQLHHTQRSGITSNGSSKLTKAWIHDPNYIAPLCKEHHQIAHSIDVKFHEVRQRSRR